MLRRASGGIRPRGRLSWKWKELPGTVVVVAEAAVGWPWCCYECVSLGTSGRETQWWRTFVVLLEGGN